MRKRDFTYMLNDKENERVNELIEKFESEPFSKMCTKTEKQFLFMNNLSKIFNNDYQKTFTIYTNSDTTFQK